MQIFNNEDEILEFINWENLSKNASESTIEKYADLDPPRLDWLEISRNPKCSEDFYRRYLHKVCIHQLCFNPNLSEDFFEELIKSGKAYSYWLARNPNISESFFERYILAGKLFPDTLMNNPNISYEFKKKYIKDYDEKISEYYSDQE